LHGVGVPKSGSQPGGWSKHLLRQQGNKFGLGHKLFFSLFNQSQRHAAARTVGATVKAKPGAMDNFTEYVNHPEFTDDLEQAIKHPTGKKTNSILKHLLPHISLGGASVPFGPVQRCKAMTDLYGLVKFYGLVQEEQEYG
jgi:hypothetical protein